MYLIQEWELNLLRLIFRTECIYYLMLMNLEKSFEERYISMLFDFKELKKTKINIIHVLK
jgi:hypothetical protein